MVTQAASGPGRCCVPVVGNQLCESLHANEECATAWTSNDVALGSLEDDQNQLDRSPFSTGNEFNDRWDIEVPSC